MRVGHIPKIVLKAEIGLKDKSIYSPKFFYARQILGCVHVFFEDRKAILDTITAHKVGMAIAKGIPQLAPNEQIILTINGEKLGFDKPAAKRLIAALLRKADDADDFQLQNRRLFR